MLHPFVVGKSNAVWGVQIMENAEAVASENKNQTNFKLNKSLQPQQVMLIN